MFGRNAEEAEAVQHPQAALLASHSAVVPDFGWRFSRLHQPALGHATNQGRTWLLERSEVRNQIENILGIDVREEKQERTSGEVVAMHPIAR